MGDVAGLTYDVPLTFRCRDLRGWLSEQLADATVASHIALRPQALGSFDEPFNGAVANALYSRLQQRVASSATPSPGLSAQLALLLVHVFSDATAVTFANRSVHAIKIALLNLPRSLRVPRIADVGYVPIHRLARQHGPRVASDASAVLLSCCLDLVLKPIKELSYNGELCTIGSVYVRAFANVGGPLWEGVGWGRLHGWAAASGCAKPAYRAAAGALAPP